MQEELAKNDGYFALGHWQVLTDLFPGDFYLLQFDVLDHLPPCQWWSGWRSGHAKLNSPSTDHPSLRAFNKRVESVALCHPTDLLNCSLIIYYYPHFFSADPLLSFHSFLPLLWLFYILLNLFQSLYKEDLVFKSEEDVLPLLVSTHTYIHNQQAKWLHRFCINVVKICSTTSYFCLYLYL